MAVAVSKASDKKLKSARRRGQLPAKRSINLAKVGEKKTNMGLAIPGVILIVILAALLSKFLVIDRMAEVSAAESRVSQLQSRLDAGYRELADYDDISDLYAHYTFSGMTEEELQRTDRAEILALLHRSVTPTAVVESWSLTGNVMTVSLITDDLKEVNRLVQIIEADDLVDFCAVSSAANEYRRYTYLDENNELVEGMELTARLMIYFVPEGGEQG